MSREQYITEEKDGYYKVNGKWYNKFLLEHLQEVVIEDKQLLVEYNN